MWLKRLAGSGDAPRIACSISKSGDDRLELLAHTTEAADAAESWFSDLAGDAVERIALSLSDPRRLWKERYPQHKDVDDAPIHDLTAEEKAAMMEQMYRQTYANWADEPVRALKNKTPHQALRSKAARRDVIELLKSYEVSERTMAEADGREPIDLGFLRDELGLTDES